MSKRDKTAEARGDAPEHLAYAYSILCDYLKEFDGDYTMSKETAETLIQGAAHRIVLAGRAIGIELDKWRVD